MYIETHLIPTKRDEWIINLHLEDNTKIKANIVKGYKECLIECQRWSAELGDIPYEVGNVKYNESK